jgi:hypothetical protein
VLTSGQIQDIKALLGEKTDEEKKSIPQNSLVDLLSLGRAGMGSNLEQLLPQSQGMRDTLLDVYFANVDPMVRITHRSTVVRKFASYNRETHPIAFAIYFSAINSLPPNVVKGKFHETKASLLDKLQLGVEISLARENYLTSSSLEIFQGFVLWLTCITREEDMGTLTDLAFVSTTLTFSRQGMGFVGHCIPHCSESRSAPRSLSIPKRFHGRYNNRIATSHVAPAEPSGIPSR